MSRHARECEQCESEFVAARVDARFCSDACRKAAARARTRATPVGSGLTRAKALEELAAMCELLPQDLTELEQRFPLGTDPVMDELLAGLEVHLRMLEQLRDHLGATS